MHNSNAFTSALYRRGVPSPCRGTWAAVLPAALAVAALLTMSTSANTVVNGDFSSNAALFTTFPGYVGGANPAAIDNWIHAGGSNRGINGVGISNPFGPTDKSAATYYGFIQGTGGTLSQTLTLSANTAYDISFSSRQSKRQRRCGRPRGGGGQLCYLLRLRSHRMGYRRLPGRDRFVHKPGVDRWNHHDYTFQRQPGW